MAYIWIPSLFQKIAIIVCSMQKYMYIQTPLLGLVLITNSSKSTTLEVCYSIDSPTPMKVHKFFPQSLRTQFSEQGREVSTPNILTLSASKVHINFLMNSVQMESGRLISQNYYLIFQHKCRNYCFFKKIFYTFYINLFSFYVTQHIDTVMFECGQRQ